MTGIFFTHMTSILSHKWFIQYYTTTTACLLLCLNSLFPVVSLFSFESYSHYQLHLDILNSSSFYHHHYLITDISVSDILTDLLLKIINDILGLFPLLRMFLYSSFLYHGCVKSKLLTI